MELFKFFEPATVQVSVEIHSIRPVDKSGKEGAVYVEVFHEVGYFVAGLEIGLAFHDKLLETGFGDFTCMLPSLGFGFHLCPCLYFCRFANRWSFGENIQPVITAYNMVG